MRKFKYIVYTLKNMSRYNPTPNCLSKNNKFKQSYDKQVKSKKTKKKLKAKKD
jgi:hypothetical protein